ncbi:adenylosuccinate synthetase [Paenibacillus curdlanolyticus YK9]|uniref:Adenylosuccinate synthetase n=1 Tax=Paenibacillus curdlanolyticus YK9 TaxID=717606 RepID=E0IDA2_9BACL|nr:adenylosuccinate synthase [Paenibacillus curdlanolyticus]EFM09557.1 adenylosuccinate synthetase [Paenibacillus curdlanolyticus YK9]
MSVTAVVGANWGDEGKGKITDVLAEQFRYIVRYQGGSNAGHTIINDLGRFALHLLPSGVLLPNTINVIGPGVAFDPHAFLQEYDTLISRGIANPDIRISDRVQLVMPYHILFDALEEERLGARSFGSTRSGIAPFYADKYLKTGIQLTELFGDALRLRNRIQASVEAKNIQLQHLYNHAPLDANKITNELLSLTARLSPFVCDTSAMLQTAHAADEAILVEGQLGALRDPDHGIYPYVTSSSTLAGFAAIGAGVPPQAITRIIAVTKAYSSCVGAGPFVTELSGSEAEELRKRGGDAGEYGVKTRRPRRVGWFDIPATRYGSKLQGATEVVMTNLDVLSYLDTIPVCTGYRVDGEELAAFPATGLLERAEPIWTMLPGWKGSDLTRIRRFVDLPPNAQRYVLFIEQAIDVPIRMVSVGPHREQIIYR